MGFFPLVNLPVVLVYGYGNMVCFRYIIVNIVHIGDNKGDDDDDDNNNNINNNNRQQSECICS